MYVYYVIVVGLELLWPLVLHSCKNLSHLTYTLYMFCAYNFNEMTANVKHEAALVTESVPDDTGQNMKVNKEFEFVEITQGTDKSSVAETRNSLVAVCGNGAETIKRELVRDPLNGGASQQIIRTDDCSRNDRSDTHIKSESGFSDSTGVEIKSEERLGNSCVTKHQEHLTAIDHCPKFSPQKSKNALRLAWKRSLETPEERRRRNQINALRNATRRASETEEERKMRLEKNAMRLGLKRRMETVEQKKERQKKNALRAADRRSLEINEERVFHQLKNKTRSVNKEKRKSKLDIITQATTCNEVVSVNSNISNKNLATLKERRRQLQNDKEIIADWVTQFNDKFEFELEFGI